MKSGIIVSLLALGFCADAFANNMFIPNYYRNRRVPNAYSAIGWSDRKEVEVQYEMEDSDRKRNGTKIEDSETDSMQAHLFYRTPVNLNVETVMGYSKEDEKNPVTGDKDETKIKLYHLGLGYELTEMPLAFGAIFTLADGETTGDSGDSDEEITAIGLGVGYRLAGDKYLGFGLTRSNYDRSSATSNSDDDVDSFSIGAGKVYGDGKSPLAANELTFGFMNFEHTQFYGLDLRGLYNLENIQFYGEAGYDWSNGQRGSDGFSLKGGVDYLFGVIYVGPEVIYSVTNTDSGNTSDVDSLRISVETGYRVDFLEAYLRYTSDESESEFAVRSFNSKTEKDTWTVGASYQF